MQSHLRQLLLSQEDQVWVEWGGGEDERITTVRTANQRSRSQRLRRHDQQSALEGGSRAQGSGDKRQQIWGTDWRGRTRCHHTRAVEKGRIEPLVGKRVRRTARNGPRRQPRDQIWTRRSGLQRDTPHAQRELWFRESPLPFRCALFQAAPSATGRCFNPVKKKDLPVKGLAVHKNKKTRKCAFMKETLTAS